MTDENKRLVEAVAAGRKYRSMSRELIAAVAERERRGAKSEAELIKATRNKLHQVVCAYQEGTPHYDRWLADLQTAAASGNRAVFAAQCQAIMRHHASTRERLPIVEAFYAAAVPDWSRIRTVVDVGCGLNPLALPLLGIQLGTRYHAYEVQSDLVDFLNRYFEIASPLLGVEGNAEVCDAAHRPECLEKPTDLALLLKLLPCLEQIEKGAGERLLREIDAERILVSFPVRTLGGGKKGLGKTYEAWLRETIQPLGLSAQRFEFPSELAFLLSSSGKDSG